MEFLGKRDAILQNRLYESVGFELFTLIATVSNIESVNLSDFLNWSVSCPELDASIQKNTNEAMNLENFLLQTFTNIKTKYAQKHKLILQSEIDELENNLVGLSFKKTSILQRILGQKKRLLRLGLLADQRESETQESSVNDTTNNQNESSVNDTTQNNQND